MFGRLAAWVLAHRPLALLLLLVVTAAAMAGLPRLYFDFRFTGFVGSHDPAFAELAVFTEAWGRADERLLLLAETGDGTLLDEPRLEALASALDDVAALDSVDTAIGLPSFPRNASDTPALLDLRPLIETLPSSADEQAAWRARLLEDRDLVPMLLSRDGRATVAVATLSIDTDDILAVRPAIEAVREALAPHEGLQGIRWSAAGIPAVRSDLVTLLLDDTFRFALLSVCVAILLLLLLFRSLHGVVVPLGSTVVPVAILYGVMGWTGEPIGLLSQIYVTLIPAIAIADAIHIVSRFHEEARARIGTGVLTADARHDAIVSALENVGFACLFTSLTTAVGFASLAVADMRVLRSFGLYAALGILLAFVTMVVVVPLLLSLVRAVPKATEDTRPGVMDAVLAGASRVALGSPKSVLVVAAAVAVVFGALGSTVEVNNWLRDNLAPGHHTQHANDLLDEKLGGTLPLHVDLRGPPGALYTPEVLAASARLEGWARALPEVRAVFGPAETLSRLTELVVGERRLPDSPALARQVLLLTEGSGAADLVLKEGGGRGRIMLQLPDLGGRRFEELAREVETAAIDAFRNMEVTPVISGVSYVAYRGLNRLSGELVASLVAAFAVITAMLALLFRDLRVSLLCLVPNAMPLVVCLGAMALLRWDMNPTSAVVFTVALGIAVDDTIHLVARVYEGIRGGLSGDEVLSLALQRTGRALFITSVILAVGFGLNAFSAFRINRWFGVLGTLAIASAFVLDVLVLPALLKLFGPRAMRRKGA